MFFIYYPAQGRKILPPIGPCYSSLTWTLRTLEIERLVEQEALDKEALVYCRRYRVIIFLFCSSLYLERTLCHNDAQNVYPQWRGKVVKLHPTRNYSGKNTHLSYLPNHVYNTTFTTALKYYYYRNKVPCEVLTRTEHLFINKIRTQITTSAISQLATSKLPNNRDYWIVLHIFA